MQDLEKKSLKELQSMLTLEQQVEFLFAIVDRYSYLGRQSVREHLIDYIIAKDKREYWVKLS